jgi:hypothetical protein
VECGIFFANQGEFTTGDYEEIMNKASCLSLVSNAVLYWNTMKINDIVEELRRQGEEIDNETLSHISLLPFKHVVPNQYLRQNRSTCKGFCRFIELLSATTTTPNLQEALYPELFINLKNRPEKVRVEPR